MAVTNKLFAAGVIAAAGGKAPKAKGQVSRGPAPTPIQTPFKAKARTQTYFGGKQTGGISDELLKKKKLLGQ
jgi:hypothetical protein